MNKTSVSFKTFFKYLYTPGNSRKEVLFTPTSSLLLAVSRGSGPVTTRRGAASVTLIPRLGAVSFIVSPKGSHYMTHEYQTCGNLTYNSNIKRYQNLRKKNILLQRIGNSARTQRLQLQTANSNKYLLQC